MYSGLYESMNSGYIFRFRNFYKNGFVNLQAGTGQMASNVTAIQLSHCIKKDLAIVERLAKVDNHQQSMCLVIITQSIPFSGQMHLTTGSPDICVDRRLYHGHQAAPEDELCPLAPAEGARPPNSSVVYVTGTKGPCTNITPVTLCALSSSRRCFAL